MRLNQLVAISGLILACSIFFILHQYGFPDKITFGASILSILFVAIVWSTASLTLGGGDDDE